jgi:acetyl-CoA decarbonylase/synthase complex subunit epsilon
MIPWQPTAIAGPRQARVAKKDTAVRMLEKAERPLLVIGPIITCSESCNDSDCNKEIIRSLCMDIARNWDIPVVTLGPAYKSFKEEGFETEVMGVIELINLLKDPEWEGFRREGQHDLVLFIGVTYYIASQGLSTLKHFAPHLKTLTLCKLFHPNADVSFPNMSEKKWLKLLENMKKPDEEL